MNLDLIKILANCKNMFPEEGEELRSLLLNDLKNYFYILADADKRSKKEEIQFINRCLDTSYSSLNDLKKELKETGVLNKELNLLPKSYSKLQKISEDTISKSVEVYDLMGTIKKLLSQLGLEILACDLKTSSGELKVYTKYMSTLDNALVLMKTRADVCLEEDDDDNYYIEPTENDEDEQDGQEESLEELILELDSLIGLESAKEEIHQMINLIKVRNIRAERGFENIPMSYHMVFVGNPGTGKTTVARLLAKIYRELGVVSSGQFIETDRSGLVAGYIGQTSEKVTGVLDSAKGGILFIDEAYSLTYKKTDGDYGFEAVDVILKYMEDNRDDIIVVVAGYPEPMDDFLNSNPGLKSRFPKYIRFEDYSCEELLEIFISICNKNNYLIDEEGQEAFIDYLNSLSEEKLYEFGNARGVRNLFEKAVTKQASRIVQYENIDDDTLVTLVGEDIF